MRRGYVLLSVFVVLVAFVGVTSSACTGTRCTQCVVDTTCGWCSGTRSCVSGGKSGPSSGSCNGTWYHKHSQIVWTEKGPIVTPRLTEVFLMVGQQLVVPIQVNVPPAVRQPFDLWLSEDITGSMGDDVATLALLIPRLISSVRSIRPDTNFAYATFGDKPMSPAGDYGSYRTDNDFWPHATLNANYNGLQAKVQETVIGYGNDWEEASLVGVVQSTCPSYGWRETALKMVVTMTDAPYHYEKQLRFSSCWSGAYMTVNDYDCTDECQTSPCYPSGQLRDASGNSLSQCRWYGTGEDYPSVTGLKAHLTSKNVFPLWLITSDSKSYYDSLTTSVGFGKVATITSSSSNVITAIQEGIDYLTSNLILLVSTDTYLYCGSPARISPASYTGVVPFKTYIFNVTLLASTVVYNTTINLSVLGWGLSDIKVTNTFPCYGCDHVVDSGKDYDKCALCVAPADANKCLDCKGVPYGISVMDNCDVCAGDGQSCLDCFGEVWGTAVEDACGVCGGDNSTCFGCDGTPSATMYDLCGVCNGTNACLDCQQVPYGTKKLDNCSVCGGNNACQGCDGLFTVPPAQYDQCNKCGGDGTSCIDCFGVVNGTAEPDDCGVCEGNNTCIGCDGEATVPPLQYNECGGCGAITKTCRGCDGVLWSAAAEDECGICKGTNSCFDCSGEPWGQHVYDLCGQCVIPGDPTMNDCLGCDNVPFSGKELDYCYVCDGSNTCFGCDGVAYSGKQYDGCGECGKDGTECTGCDGAYWSKTVLDDCKVCGGSNACVGCDNVPNSGYFYNGCGDCTNDPTEMACVGCDGVPWSGAVEDVCGVCNGDSTCVGCDGVKYSGMRYDVCGACNGNRECIDCFGIQWEGAVLDVCGVCGGNGSSCTGCDNVTYSGLKYDECGVCGGHNLCWGCDREPFSGKKVDDCGVCGGLNRALGCDGVCFSGMRYDQCGLCDGNNSCVGCNGVAWSGMKLDDCEECGGHNGCFGCDGVPSKTAYDLCGVCGGDNLCCGCDGSPYSGLKVDNCSVCGGNNECIGCDGLPGYKDYDLCGVCGGSNACFGCDYVPFSGRVTDRCGICGGANTCVGCDNVTYSYKTYDSCGVCGGDNECFGCDYEPYSGKEPDKCGVCDGNNDCLGCDGKPGTMQYDLCGQCTDNVTIINDCFGCDYLAWSGLEYDKCDVCGGTNACVGCDGVAWSGAQYDACGTCGGDGIACIGCDQKMWSGKYWDGCGVCGGDNSTCTGCDGVIGSSASYDSCGKCNGTDACMGCDGVLYSGLKEDACGNCGGTVSEKDKSKCNDAATKNSLIATGTIIGVTLGCAAAAIAGFFLYKHIRYGANWYIPNSLLDGSSSGATSNPIYDETGAGGMQSSTLYSSPTDNAS
ncbi:exocyst complex subunit 4 [Pelomyxa schiedti]|nr:exocyst complex subunit 4 [Pelomyxa schiedti]